MSARALTWAWEQTTQSSGERLVLIALADRADDEGLCWPSAAWLARKAQLDPGTVRRHLKTLHDRGLLERERRRRGNGTLGTYEYRLAVDIVESLGITTDDQRASMRGRPARTGARAETTSSYRNKHQRASTRGGDQRTAETPPPIGSPEFDHCPQCSVRGGRHRFDCPETSS